MSHNVTMRAAVVDLASLATVCQRRHVELHVGKNAEALQMTLRGREVPGVASFRPDEWENDVIVQKNGDLVYDNWNGRWGDIKHLHGLLHDYQVEAAVNAAGREGLRLESHTRQEDGWAVLELVE